MTDPHSHVMGRAMTSYLRSAGGSALGAVAILAALAGLSISPLARRAPDDRTGPRPNIVLITVDSLRADHLGVYGYPRPTSPGLDAFALQATVVTDAIAQAPYTKASMATMLTGLFPVAHKTYSTSVPLEELHASGAAGVGRLPLTDVLSPEIPSLPVFLRRAGYRTLAFSANPYLIPEFGFANGFDEFRYISGAGGAYAHASEVMAAAQAAVAGVRSPFFLWVHLMDPHNPYDPPAAFRALLPPLRPPQPVARQLIPEWVRLGDEVDLNVYLARYDAGVRSADAAIAGLFEVLRERHQWDQTAVVVTADHGEGFLEHGLMSHNNSLYDELLHVPLIMKLPGVPRGRVRAQVQLADLFPTLAHVAGISPPDIQHGQDQIPVLMGTGSAEQYAYAEIVGARFALRTLDQKLISSLQGGQQLFDLTADPAERTNVAKTDPRRTDAAELMLARVLSIAVKDGAGFKQHLLLVPPAVRERLRSLGYIN